MSPAAVTGRVRRLLLAGVGFLLLWQAAAVLGAPRSVQVYLGLHGFVLHVAFAKAYALLPAYFVRELSPRWAPAVHLPLSTLGVVGLVVGALGGPRIAGVAGAALWSAGAAVFVAAIGWTVRDNPTGAETGTGEAKADRRPVDRFANAFVPAVLAYLLAGAADLFAGRAGLPTLVGGGPASTHLLAAGTATLLVLAVGFRLLPRLLVVRPPRALVAVVLPAGALAPALLAGAFLDGIPFLVGAALEAVAVGGFAVAVAVMVRRSDRRRVGVYALLLAAAAGVAGVGLGVDFALRAPGPALVAAHVRLNLLGFLGLAIVGTSLHFYPPAAGRFRGAGDRMAAVAVALLAGGLAVEVVGGLAGLEPAATVGRLLALAGAATYAYLLVGLLREQGRG